MNIKCLLVDDEPLALKQIVSYIDQTPFLGLLEQFDSAIQAISFLRENKVDLMFVDINMPDLNGMDFVKSLNNPPRVIFTTAYRDYAVDGFDLKAVDYLLKPISFERLLQGVQKYYEESTSRVREEKEKLPVEKDDSIFVRADRKMVKINFQDSKECSQFAGL